MITPERIAAIEGRVRILAVTGSIPAIREMLEDLIAEVRRLQAENTTIRSSPSAIADQGIQTTTR